MKSETECDEIIAKLYQELPPGTVCDKNTHTKCRNASNLIRELLNKKGNLPKDLFDIYYAIIANITHNYWGYHNKPYNCCDIAVLSSTIQLLIEHGYIQLQQILTMMYYGNYANISKLLITYFNIGGKIDVSNFDAIKQCFDQSTINEKFEQIKKENIKLHSSLLQFACFCGIDDFINYMLGQKHIPDQTCLFYAIKNGSITTMKNLILYGCVLDSKSLEQACEISSDAVIKFILDNKIAPTTTAFRNIIKRNHAIMGYNPRRSLKYNSTQTNKIIQALKLVLDGGYIPTYDDAYYALDYRIEIPNLVLYNIKIDTKFQIKCTELDFYPYGTAPKPSIDILRAECKKSGNLARIKELSKHIAPDIVCLQNACIHKNNVAAVKFLMEKGINPDVCCLTNVIKGKYHALGGFVVDKFLKNMTDENKKKYGYVIDGVIKTDNQEDDNSQDNDIQEDDSQDNDIQEDDSQKNDNQENDKQENIDNNNRVSSDSEIEEVKPIKIMKDKKIKKVKVKDDPKNKQKTIIVKTKSKEKDDDLLVVVKNNKPKEKVFTEIPKGFDFKKGVKLTKKATKLMNIKGDPEMSYLEIKSKLMSTIKDNKLFDKKDTKRVILEDDTIEFAEIDKYIYNNLIEKD